MTMSQETAQWLQENVLIGFTDHRERAWHYREGLQGAEPNHYPLAVPVGDVERRLFHWDPIPLPVFVRVPCELDEASGLDDENLPFRYIERTTRKNIGRSDTFADLGMFKQGYHAHNFRQVLLRNIEQIVRDAGESDLGISSAGLLKGGAVGWVEISVPESLKTPDGVQFRPNLLAATSCDGSLATVYKRTVTMTVCDNTLSSALGEKGQTYKIKHSKNSGYKVANAREALAIVAKTGQEFAAEVGRLLDRPMTGAQWEVVLKTVIPNPEARDGKVSKGGITGAENRRHAVNRMYLNDVRVSPWAGTAFGGLQAFNTWRHHEQSIGAGTHRAERNLLHSIDGTTEDGDAEVLRALVLAGV